MTRLDASTYLAAISAEADALARGGERAGLDAPVPSCPEWRAADLLVHIGRVHRWVAACITTNDFVAPDRLPSPPEGPGLSAWVRDGAAGLVEVLDRPPADPAWTWAPDQTIGFWQRRQAHETTMHRVDAELAGGGAPAPISEGLAADGIDEALHLLPLRPGAPPLSGEGETVHVHCTDVDGEWLVRLGDAGLEVEAIHAKGDVAVRGPAPDLLLVLARRADPGTVEVIGRRPVLDAFLARAAF
jgi:uncharacterized protein (TIGR03083 family)